MRLVNFPGHNVVFAKDQPEYLPLPAYKEDDTKPAPTVTTNRLTRIRNGQITCCWQLSWRERLKLLFTGVLWHEVWTFNHSLQPVLLTVDRPHYIPEK